MKFKIKQKYTFLFAGLLAFFSGADVLAATASKDFYVGNYYVGPEDVLSISVWKEQGLDLDVLVRPDGKLSFPLVGEITAIGKTPEQVRDEIKAKVANFIPDPVVTVLVKKVVSYKIYVIGQVKKAGHFVLGRYLDVLQALALAGGLTPFAVEDKIKILRRGKDGRQRILLFDFSAVKNGRNLQQNVVLKSGDVVVVP